ncbi:hypothetical protein BJ508DRAFT_323730 [Ascobolus immersus RN42]|uniref:Uncharacterized protein n=1 Tax=Ascobolus immersus RN42 TaxID=1160509 RepID=A0A3N4IG84_ASCIM|nr:hypothetical protein BJ508DRAFT_323730 [Ascobolus immersus RN42]
MDIGTEGQLKQENSNGYPASSKTSTMQVSIFCPLCEWHFAEEGTVFGSKPCCSRQVWKECPTIAFRNLLSQRPSPDLRSAFIVIVTGSSEDGGKAYFVEKRPLFDTLPYFRHFNASESVFQAALFETVFLPAHMPRGFTCKILERFIETIITEKHQTLLAQPPHDPLQLGYFEGRNYEEQLKKDIKEIGKVKSILRALEFFIDAYFVASALEAQGLAARTAERVEATLCSSCAGGPIWSHNYYRNWREYGIQGFLKLYRKVHGDQGLPEGWKVAQVDMDPLKEKMAAFLAYNTLSSKTSALEKVVKDLVQERPAVAQEIMSAFGKGRLVRDVMIVNFALIREGLIRDVGPKKVG